MYENYKIVNNKVIAKDELGNKREFQNVTNINDILAKKNIIEGLEAEVNYLDNQIDDKKSKIKKKCFTKEAFDVTMCLIIFNILIIIGLIILRAPVLLYKAILMASVICIPGVSVVEIISYLKNEKLKKEISLDMKEEKILSDRLKEEEENLERLEAISEKNVIIDSKVKKVDYEKAKKILNLYLKYAKIEAENQKSYEVQKDNGYSRKRTR